MLGFKGHRFEREIILVVVKWHLSYPLSYRNIDEMIQDRGLRIDHSTNNRWVVKFSGEINARVRRAKGPSTGRWNLGQSDIRIGGKCMCFHRAVDNHGDTIDFFLSENRDKRAAETFLEKAVTWDGTPEHVTIDKSGANKSALGSFNRKKQTEIEACQSKDKNNSLEQAPRTIKRHVKMALGHRTIESASATIAGIEAVHMLRKGQVSGLGTTLAQTFWALVT